MNIKSDEAHRLAREIAEPTGDSMTGAVLTVLREKRGRLAAGDPARAAAIRRWLGYGERIRARTIGAIPKSTDDGGLWDERGLPE